jgi:hypothetical protein
VDKLQWSLCRGIFVGVIQVICRPFKFQTGC